MSVDGSGQTNLTNNPAATDKSPSWSPDGVYILFDYYRRGDNNGFQVMNADGSNVKFLRDGGYTVAAWSPDGKRIAFGIYRAPDFPIGIMNADGSGWTQLATTSYSRDGNASPSWSPDSKRIVFKADANLFIINIDGSNLTRLTDGSSPAWSPNGQRIAFKGSDGNIYLINPDGTNATRLTSTGKDTEPTWSPDSQRIAFTSRRDGNSEIYVMNVDGSGQTNLTNNAAADYLPAWQP